MFEFGPPPQPRPELGVFSEHEIEAARRSAVLGIVPLQLAALCVMTLYDDEAERARNVPRMRETGFDNRFQLQRSKILEAAGVPIGSLQMRGEILAKRRFATWKGREAAECSRLRAEVEAGRWQPDINPEIADDYVTVMQARPNH